MKRRKGRPNLMLTCDSRPGETFTIPQAAAISGTGRWGVYSAAKRGRPTGPDRLMFRKVPVVNKTKILADPECDAIKSSLVQPSPKATGDDLEEWMDRLEMAYERHGDDVSSIFHGSIIGERTEAFGLSIDADSHFEDVDAFACNVVALALDRNPLRDEFFSVCREVMKRMP